MIISLIVAMDSRRGIGLNNQLPWRLSADLKRFRELTMGHHVVTGRKTYESIGRPLPGRRMIIVTRNSDFHADGCDIVHSIDEAISLARSRDESELFIIGGAEIYAQTLPLAQRLYLTQVHASVEADTFFPVIAEADWVETESAGQATDEKNQYSCAFQTLKRIAS